MRIRRYIRFFGRVQGVGFRRRARAAANELGASGWVRNLRDGSVEMEIQGLEEQIDLVIQALEQSPYIDIRSMESKQIDTTEESGFRLLY